MKLLQRAFVSFACLAVLTVSGCNSTEQPGGPLPEGEPDPALDDAAAADPDAS